ncbi:MAG: hypothetical protein JNG84_11995, partial [Archangium sp.]|nr:hypothetical protein [Archangium sp.]
MKPSRSRVQPVTLVLSMALAATVVSLLYLAVTSLPYLSTSPTADPTFGTVNACLLRAVPSRVGFAVSFDAGSAAAWNHERLVR